jgi:cystathionine beta-lyase family protein involved in aluminum resistance
MVNLWKALNLPWWYAIVCATVCISITLFQGYAVSHFYIVWQGADLMAGSLIKNPGGTIAPCGGYVAGKKKLVEAAAARLSAPGLGVDCGSTPGDIMRAFFQGLFLSPQMVGEAIKVLDFSFH